MLSFHFASFVLLHVINNSFREKDGHIRKEERNRHHHYCHITSVRENYDKLPIIIHKSLPELILDFENDLII